MSSLKLLCLHLVADIWPLFHTALSIMSELLFLDIQSSHLSLKHTRAGKQSQKTPALNRHQLLSFLLNMRLAENVEKHWKTNARVPFIRQQDIHVSVAAWGSIWSCKWEVKELVMMPQWSWKAQREKKKTKPEKHYHMMHWCIWSIHNFPASVSMSNACMCVFVEAFQLLNMTEHQRWAF